MLIVMVLNKNGLWVAMPFDYDSEREAWEAARSYKEYQAVRIVRLVGEIQRETAEPVAEAA